MSTPNLAKAIIAVMSSVKGVEKSMTVGTGSNSYKGVADKDVKQIVGEAMEKNGLCIIPIGVEAKTQIDRWEEIDQHSKVAGATKQKQSVFTEVTTKYLLLHESGESIELMGYGHGIDAQDKGAGKATTYALKYALLYAFLVPTGKIDDADNTHSDELPLKPAAKNTVNPLQSWIIMLDKCKSRADVAAVYTANKEAIDSNENLKNLLKEYQGKFPEVKKRETATA